MKLPSASTDGTSPSGSSFASTYPGVWGSRVGGVGRFGRAGAGAEFVVWPTARSMPVPNTSTAQKNAPQEVIFVMFILIVSRRKGCNLRRHIAIKKLQATGNFNT